MGPGDQLSLSLVLSLAHSPSLSLSHARPLLCSSAEGSFALWVIVIDRLTLSLSLIVIVGHIVIVYGVAAVSRIDKS